MRLTEFLLARIAEDEAAAREEDADYAATTLLPTYDSEHQARWNTERVLAECEAKRRIVELHFENDPGPDAECGACGDIGGYYSQVWPCPTIKALAAVYADHPDYDEAWRP
ncbi:DUF6221 family protein [Oerskovia jenensis]|uniref:DUF6221 family protein n=1 Tax=Oerskovia jenensis TaxID=162169 RepID=UPI0036D7E4BF